MVKLVLSSLKRVDLREVWSNEATNFTPWLAQPDNLKQLGEAIGIELQPEGIEKPVGPYRADILCKDLEENWVLIENQIERTDHSHLGQILTYAAGLDAVTIVWIAQSFTEEHRAALDWLNNVTSEDINFFGLEIELWRIDDSAVAPKYNVVCQPNDWIKQVGLVRKASSQSELDTLKLQFWTDFRAYLEQHGSFMKAQKPSMSYWMDFAVGRTNFRLSAQVGMRDGYIGVMQVIKGPDGKAHYHLLLKERGEIEREIGEEMEWRENPNYKQSDISIYRRDVTPTDKDQWPEYFGWLQTKLEALHKVLAPRIRALNAAEYPPPIELAPE